MHYAQIKAALEMAGISQSALARSIVGRHGRAVSSAAVHHVIRGISRSSAIALAISRATGLPVAELWPGKYPELERRQRRAARRRAK